MRPPRLDLVEEFGDSGAGAEFTAHRCWGVRHDTGLAVKTGCRTPRELDSARLWQGMTRERVSSLPRWSFWEKDQCLFASPTLATGQSPIPLTLLCTAGHPPPLVSLSKARLLGNGFKALHDFKEPEDSQFRGDAAPRCWLKPQQSLPLSEGFPPLD